MIETERNSKPSVELALFLELKTKIQLNEIIECALIHSLTTNAQWLPEILAGHKTILIFRRSTLREDERHA